MLLRRRCFSIVSKDRTLVCSSIPTSCDVAPPLSSVVTVPPSQTCVAMHHRFHGDLRCANVFAWLQDLQVDNADELRDDWFVHRRSSHWRIWHRWRLTEECDLRFLRCSLVAVIMQGAHFQASLLAALSGPFFFFPPRQPQSLRPHSCGWERAGRRPIVHISTFQPNPIATMECAPYKVFFIIFKYSDIRQ